MRWLAFTVLALLIAGPGLASDAERPESFLAVAPLQLKPGEALQRLGLPWGVLQASRSAGLADVRVFDAQGNVVPQAWAQPAAAGEEQRSVALPAFAWPEAAGGTPELPVQLQLSSHGTLLRLQLPAGRAQPRSGEGQARQWLLDLSGLKDLKEEKPLSLKLDWPASIEGLSSAVQLERSEDGQHWSVAGQGRLLELAAAGAPRIDSVEWPAGAPLPRYLRLRFDNAIALKSAQLALSRRLASPDYLQQVLFAPVTGPAALWQVDLQGRFAPQALALQLPPGNQLLNLRLEQRNAEAEPWRAVARFVAWRMQRNGVDGSSPPEKIFAEPARFWRLVPEGPVPAAVQGQVLSALWHWQPPQLVLLAQGQGAEGFRLAVGRSGMPRPALDSLPNLMPGYRLGDEYKLPEATLGPLQSRPEAGWQESLSAPDAATRRRWLLWGVLIAAVIGLAWMARGLLGQIKPPPG